VVLRWCAGGASPSSLHGLHLPSGGVVAGVGGAGAPSKMVQVQRQVSRFATTDSAQDSSCSSVAHHQPCNFSVCCAEQVQSV